MKKILVDLTKELVQMPSITSDIPDLNRIIDHVQAIFDACEGAYVQKIVYNDKPSLLVQNFSGKHADVVLNAHLDVVPCSQDDQFLPIEKHGKLYARGAGDMKAGAAILITLMKDLLQDSNFKKKVTLMLTTDEEVGGMDGVGYLVSKGYTGDIVLIPDGGATNSVVHAQKGVFMATIQAEGVACHSSRPWLGDNALHNIINYFIALREELQDTYKVYHTDDHRWTSTNLNVLHGGQVINAVPDNAVAKIDIRFTEKYTKDKIRKKVLDQLHSFHCTLVDEVTGELLYTEPSNPHLMKYLALASKILWEEVALEKEDGASDGRYFSSTASAVIVHRPTCKNIHGKEEYVVVDDIEKIYRVYKAYIYSI